MIRNLKFDLDVDTNALLCPNPDEFYSKAYLTEDIADNYRTLPSIKSATKLANVEGVGHFWLARKTLLI